MKQSPRPKTLTIVLLLVVGFVAVVLALWLFDQQQVLSSAGIIVVLLLGVFFLSYTAALWLYLRRRSRARLSSPVTTPSHADLKGTVYGLMPDHEYQVVQAFTDYYGTTFEQSERLHFQQRHFLPYHGGHTLIFAERPLYLQEDQNRGILEDFSAYIAPVEQ